MALRIWDYLNRVDTAALARACADAEPFPHFAIDGFLRENFAREVLAGYPAYEAARGLGREFAGFNEARKVQVTNAGAFAAPVVTLSQVLADGEFLDVLSTITGIPKLLADPKLAGGGMHLMAPGARLDVHVDFNRLEEPDWHRRLNILLFLNDPWEESWGGLLELWDPQVKRRARAFVPAFNRCVVFATSEISFHGVTPVECPPGHARRSFAGYYYTREAPPDYVGRDHTTIFRSRPDEWFRGRVLMPVATASQNAARRVRRVGDWVRRRLGA